MSRPETPANVTGVGRRQIDEHGLENGRRHQRDDEPDGQADDGQQHALPDDQPARSPEGRAKDGGPDFSQMEPGGALAQGGGALFDGGVGRGERTPASHRLALPTHSAAERRLEGAVSPTTTSTLMSTIAAASLFGFRRLGASTLPCGVDHLCGLGAGECRTGGIELDRCRDPEQRPVWRAVRSAERGVAEELVLGRVDPAADVPPGAHADLVRLPDGTKPNVASPANVNFHRRESGDHGLRLTVRDGHDG